MIPSGGPPLITIGLIAVNTLVWLFQIQRSPESLQQVLPIYGVVPASFAWPTVLTAQFLHAGWLHFAGNMLYLWIFGDNVEDQLGRGRYLMFYVFCGSAAALVHVVASPGSTVPMVGASGAIAGVLGAYFLMFPHSRVLTLLPFVVLWDIIELPASFFLGVMGSHAALRGPRIDGPNHRRGGWNRILVDSGWICVGGHRHRDSSTPRAPPSRVVSRSIRIAIESPERPWRAPRQASRADPDIPARACPSSSP